MSDYTSLKGVSNIGDSLLNDMLTNNLADFFSWGLLGIGSFFNITRPSSGVYGGAQHRLRLCDDPYYTKGQVWETYRSNWVWESGIEYGVQPIQISGVYINNVFFQKDNSGSTTFNFNYPQGRVIFDNPISTDSVVEMEYSYKYINVYTSDSLWFRELQFNSLRVDDNQFQAYGSGVWSILSQNRVQMPAVIVETVPRRTFQGRELGGGHYIFQDVLFHIYAETPYERNNLADIISYQKFKTIYLYDRNAITNSGAWPITLAGAIASGAMCYPDLVNNFKAKPAFFYELNSEDMENTVPGLYQASVRATLEIDFPEI